LGVRLFLAIDLTSSVRAEFDSLMARLKCLERHARWVRPEGMHVTVKYLGETRDEMVPEICRALESLHSPKPVELRFRGLGFFPNERRPRVFWAGVESSSNLAAIAQGANQALEPLGFPREARAYLPHLTLARFNEPGGAAKLIRAAKEFSAREYGSSVESEFHLIQSFLQPSGAEYKKLASFAFVKVTI
jgi:RNA 2',3'-cyclic 3'-phosphodiesterase